MKTKQQIVKEFQKLVNKKRTKKEEVFLRIEQTNLELEDLFKQLKVRVRVLNYGKSKTYKSLDKILLINFMLLYELCPNKIKDFNMKIKCLLNCKKQHFKNRVNERGGKLKWIFYFIFSNLINVNVDINGKLYIYKYKNIKMLVRNNQLQTYINKSIPRKKCQI